MDAKRSQNCLRLCLGVYTSRHGCSILLLHDLYDSLCAHSQHVAQGMCPNLFAIDWPRHVVDLLARVLVQKASPSLGSPLSNAQSRKVVCGSTSVHAGMNPPISRMETNLVYVRH